MTIGDEINYQGPQDKFLIMLLERLETLEDEFRKQNKQLEQILSLTTAKYFSFYVNGCVINDKRSQVNLIIHEIANIIHHVIPLITMHGRYYFENTGCCICLETEDPWLFKTVKHTVTNQLRDCMPQTIVNSWEMHTKVPPKFTRLVEKTDDMKFVGIIDKD